MGQTTMKDLTFQQRKLVEKILETEASRHEGTQAKVDQHIIDYKLGINLAAIRRVMASKNLSPEESLNHNTTAVTGKTAGAMNLR